MKSTKVTERRESDIDFDESDRQILQRGIQLGGAHLQELIDSVAKRSPMVKTKHALNKHGYENRN